MPYWMYALEELRCDLNTYRETATRSQRAWCWPATSGSPSCSTGCSGSPRPVNRSVVHDGLGGQILFAWLHKQGVLNWTDNTRASTGNSVQDSVVELCEQVEKLYRDGIDPQPGGGHWLAIHEFVKLAGAPAPDPPGRAAARGCRLRTRRPSTWCCLDEFPLNVFYEAPAQEAGTGHRSDPPGMTGAAA